jgi:hypothetical protein
MRNSRTKNLPSSVRSLVIQSFLQVRDGRSADVVIADPVLNAKFIAACRASGATESSADLNRCLYNLRKARSLEDHPTLKRVSHRQDDYSFASEIAARFLEQREHTSLDRIICDPVLAKDFDKLAEELAPGFMSFEYRFAALSLRKTRRLKPEIVSRIVATTQVEVFRVQGLNTADIPRAQGVYVLYYKKAGVLYVGEAVVLRNRIRQHLDHSDRKELARWLWEKGTNDLYVEIHVLPDGTSSSERKALERELIKSRQPRFNVSGAESKED